MWLFQPLSTLAICGAANAAVLSLPITILNTYAVVDFDVGTPGQHNRLLFDTGSGSSWIANKICAHGSSLCPNPQGYNKTGYDIAASSTGVNTHVIVSITYSGGDIYGPAEADFWTAPTDTGETLTWNQTFIAANHSSWSSNPADGFLGMGFSPLAVNYTNIVVDTLFEDGLLDEPRFGIYYGTQLTDSVNSTLGDGVMTIGGSREEEFVDGDLTVIPVGKVQDMYVYWGANVLSVTGTKSTGINGSEVTTVVDPNIVGNTTVETYAVFDTGGGQILVPPTHIVEIYDSIGMNYTAIITGKHLPSCTEFNSSWSVSFTFPGLDDGTATLTMTGDQLAIPGFAYQADKCWPPFASSGGTTYFSMGPRLLGEFYTVFDYGSFNKDEFNPTMSFGKLKPEYQPAP